MKKENKFEKEIVGMILLSEYIGYIKNIKKDTKFMFVYRNEIMDLRTVEKIFKSFGKGKGDIIENWSNFTKEFGKIAAEDKEFMDYLDDMDERCEKCGYKPVKREKLSRYHKDWIKEQKEYEKEFGKDNKKDLIGVFIEICPNCNDEVVVSTGIDENPEEGLR